jgi:hypothetical protein
VVQKVVPQAVPVAALEYEHAPAVHAAPVRHVGVDATQSVQEPPPRPHALAPVPVVHAPPALQQPAHGPSEQSPPATQRFVVALQTAPAGQSAALEQPHPPATQAVPLGLPAQAPHTAPPVPHCVPVCDPVGTQLRPLQQPVAHEVVVHAHSPLTQAWPLAQLEHAPPAAPHALVLVPATH